MRSNVSLLTNVNSLNYQSIGYYLALSGLIVFLSCFDKRKHFLFLKMCIYFVSFLLIVITGSRGPLVAFFLGTSAIAFFRSKKIFVLLLVFLIAFLIFLGPIIDLLFRYFPNFSTGVIRGLSFFYFGRDRNFPISDQMSSRYPYYEKALSLFFEKPFFGSGVGGFSYFSEVGIYPHNIFLELLTEYGVIGISLFILISLLFIIFLIINFKNTLKKYSL